MLRVRRTGDIAPADLDAFLAAGSQDPHLWFRRGLRRRAAGAFAEAVQDLTEAIRLAPTAACLYCERAGCWAEMHCLEKALADANAAIRIAPRNSNAYVTLGLAYTQLEAFEAAEAEFSRAIELDPLDSRPWTERGHARLCQHERGAAAVADLETALRLNPFDFHALRLRLRCRYEQESDPNELNHTSSYVAHVDRLLRYAGAEPEALVRRALIYLTAGEPEYPRCQLSVNRRRLSVGRRRLSATARS